LRSSSSHNNLSFPMNDEHEYHEEGNHEAWGVVRGWQVHFSWSLLIQPKNSKSTNKLWNRVGSTYYLHLYLPTSTIWHTREPQVPSFTKIFPVKGHTKPTGQERGFTDSLWFSSGLALSCWTLSEGRTDLCIL
jgi:hypothetical protein